jgi:hypothetical protein
MICAECAKHVASGPVRTINKKDQSTVVVPSGTACGFTDGVACAACAYSKRSGCGLVGSRFRVVCDSVANGSRCPCRWCRLWNAWCPCVLRKLRSGCESTAVLIIYRVDNAADPSAQTSAQEAADRYQKRFTVLLLRELKVVVDPAVVAQQRAARALEAIAVALTGSVSSMLRSICETMANRVVDRVHAVPRGGAGGSGGGGGGGRGGRGDGGGGVGACSFLQNVIFLLYLDLFS